MKNLMEKFLKVVRSNFIKYLFIFICTAVAILDTTTIAVCILNFAVTGKTGYLANVTNCALLVAIAFTINIYLFKKLK